LPAAVEATAAAASQKKPTANIHNTLVEHNIDDE
jgi:hypothetical protein